MSEMSSKTRWSILSQAVEESKRSGAASASDSSWHRIVEVYAPVVKHWIEQKGVADDSTKRDICQDVFVKLWQTLSRIERRTQPGSFRRYVKEIVHSCHCDYFRKLQRFPHALSNSQLDFSIASDTSDESHEGQVELDSERQIILEAIVACLDEYPTVAAQAYLMQYRDKMPIDEIGIHQNKTKGAVKTSISRMKNRFRLDLDAYRCNEILGQSPQEIAENQDRTTKAVLKGISRIRATIDEKFSDLI